MILLGHWRGETASFPLLAVANVAAISDRADVLALVFAVDYWDRLGWKDAFSKPEWTARQYAYAHASGRDGVYTPQVIINGRIEGTGLDANELAGLMRNAERGDGVPIASTSQPVRWPSGQRIGPGAEPTYGSFATIRA
jgi:hypothetical protein